MSKIGLIIEREYLTRVKKKSFILLTFLTPVLLAALIAVPLALSTLKGSEVKKIAVTDSDSLYVNRLKSDEQYQFIATTADGKVAGKPVRENTDIYAYLVIKGNLSTDTSTVSMYSESQIELELKSFVSDQLKDFAREDKIASYHIAGLDTIIAASNPKIDLNTIKWDEDGSEKESSSELALIIGMIATMIIYIFIFAYGAMVMNGVIEEKTNRIVEVIVSSVKPFQLMMGKIIGIAMVGLTQVLLWIVLLGGILSIALYSLKDSVNPEQMKTVSAQVMESQQLSNQGIHTASFTPDPGQEDDFSPEKIVQMVSNLNIAEIVIWFILYFLAGYLLYASLFAAFGSAIDSQEEAQQFTLPLTIPVLFALYAGMYSAQNPDGPLAFWCSLIPFTSPIVMMVRIPFGVPIWQLLVSYGLLVLTFIGTTALAGKIYRTGILMYGKKVSYKELWKWLKYKS
jgi:ABC-2 type transport system permease protein